MPMEVSLSPAQLGAPGDIYYTTNGSDDPHASDPHSVTFDAFDESVNTSIRSHLPDEGRSNSVWKMHPSSFQAGRTNSDIIIDSVRDVARANQYNARDYIPVFSNDVTITAVVDARGGTTEFVLQARVETPPSDTVFDQPSNNYYQIRIEPELDVVEVTRTIGNLTAELGAFPVSLANAGPEQLSFSVSGRTPVTLVAFKDDTRIFRLLDTARDRIQEGTNAAIRFRVRPPRAVPTGEIAFFQVVEAEETISKPTQTYTGPITVANNSTTIRAYQRNGAASSEVTQAQYMRIGAPLGEVVNQAPQ
jgi:hypothetical protein